MRKLFTFFLAVAASLTSLWADDIQFSNLPYIHYGDSVRVQATTSLPDMPIPTNYEYGFEYEYIDLNGTNSGGGGEPCAVQDGYMETVLRRTGLYQTYRYRPYCISNEETGERVTGEWVDIIEWEGSNSIGFSNIQYVCSGTSSYVSVNTSLPNSSVLSNYVFGIEYEYESKEGIIGNGAVSCTVLNGLMTTVLEKVDSCQYYRFRPYFVMPENTGDTVLGSWEKIDEWSIIVDGSCGPNLTWSLNKQTGLLTISGVGKMNNWASLYDNVYAPWYNYRSIITSLQLNEGITEIGEYAFFRCEKIKTVSIPSSVEVIKQRAFMYCYDLQSVLIPEGVTTLGNWLFQDDRSLLSVTIPESVTSVGHQILTGCTSLQTPIYNSHIFVYLPTSYVGDYSIPQGIETIAPASFGLCKHLEKVVIPESVTEIGDWAFYMSSLTEVNLPENITIINEYTFEACSSLRSIVIPQNVATIGNFSFRGCSGLTSITCEATVPPALGNSIFENVNKSIPLYVPAQSIGIYQMTDQWREFKVQPMKCLLASGICGAQGDNLTWELNCDSVLTISGIGTMVGGATSIPWDTYKNAIKIIIIEDGVTSIGQYAFYQCDNLSNISISNSVAIIGESAFYGCENLQSIIIPSSITAIETNAFVGCGNLDVIRFHGSTPPTISTINGDTQSYNLVFPTICNFIVPCGTNDAYLEALIAIDNSKITEDVALSFSITSSTVGQGTITVVKEPTCDDMSIVFRADAIEGYQFKKWSDGNTDNPRTIILTQDTTIMAKFESTNSSPKVFSVGENEYVYFSKGNLQYQASTDTWRFAENQYDMIGSANANISASYSGWIDLFGWGTGDNPTNISTSTSNYGTFVDWGNNAISNGGNVPNQWRTMTSDQWYYIFYSRANAASLFGLGNINGLKGMIILPDDWITPQGVSFVPSLSQNTWKDNGGSWYYNNTGDDFSSNTYDFDEWEVMEANGAVFLPAGGMRAYRSVYADKVGSTCYYWSDTPHNSSNWAYCLAISSTGVTPKHGEYRYNAISVRLVRDTILQSSIATSGVCGENWALQWNYDNANKVLTISGEGALTNNYTFGLEAPSSAEKLIISEGVTAIGNSAFSGYSTLSHISIASSINTIYEQAFYNCTGLQEIFSYRSIPPVVYSNTFDGINKFECKLYVLSASKDMYKSVTGWRDFYYIQTIDAEEVTEAIEDVIVTPTNTTVGIMWPFIEGAVSYEIVIRDSSGNVICVLTFDAAGHLMEIAFAPNRYDRSSNERTTGFQFTITGLNSGTTYSYSVEAKDADEETIDIKSGMFVTLGEIITNIDNVVDNAYIAPQKVLQNGHIFIFRGDKTYTITGQEVR